MVHSVTILTGWSTNYKWRWNVVNLGPVCVTIAVTVLCLQAHVEMEPRLADISQVQMQEFRASSAADACSAVFAMGGSMVSHKMIVNRKFSEQTSKLQTNGHGYICG